MPQTVAVCAPPSVSYTSILRSQPTEYEAFFLGRAETRGSSFEPYTLYAGTNSDLLSFNRVNTTITHAQPASCNNTDSVPFSWNCTLPDTGPVAEYVDSAGGKTSIYLVTATTSALQRRHLSPDRDRPCSNIRGSITMLQLTPDKDGEQLPNPYAP